MIVNFATNSKPISFMLRTLLVCASALGTAICAEGHTQATVVADSLYRTPLPNALIFDRNGHRAGICGADGTMPYISEALYPLTIRYMGFKEQCVTSPRDTVFMLENITELPEVTVRSKNQRVLHMLAYVREYSSLSTYTDTVYLFREKTVDYMLPTDIRGSFRGWKSPRTLAARSYYRFTDSNGLDSVSDRCNNHFSWADWVGMVPTAQMPDKVRHNEESTDTVRGKYSPTEVWTRHGARLTLDIDVMADTTSRKWVPNLSAFFRRNIDFEQFRLQLTYNGVSGDAVTPLDMTGYSFGIESNGRGRGMFMFNKVDEPFFVSTYAEVYFIDKEYITVGEAKKWERNLSDRDAIGIFEPMEAPPLLASVQTLVERVNAVDHDQVRVGLATDRLLVGPPKIKLNAGQQILQRIKGMFGLDKVNAERKWKRGWRKFTRSQTSRNNSRNDDTDTP